MNTKEQGSVGVARAIAYYTERGGKVFIPVSDVSRYDLIVDMEGKLIRVEVKTTMQENGEFALRTCGGNQSWNKVVKRIDVKDCDMVFLYNMFTGSEFERTAEELQGRCTIRLR